MQSFFRVSEMESTDKPPTPMAAVSEGKKFRNCANCTNRMPSIVFDAHTWCIGCWDQVCDMSVHCDECRDWPDSYRLAFVKYNRTLKAKRDSKVQRKARQSAAQSQSDQSVYDTDTEPIPSVQVQSDKVERVVSEAPSAEASLSGFLYVTPGNRFEQLASTLLSKFQELSDRGLNPPVQSQSVLVSGSQPSLDRPSTSFVAATDQLGVAAPLEGIILPNPIDPVFRLSTTPVSGETPVHRLAAIDRKLQTLEQSIASSRQMINSFWDGGLAPPQSLVDLWIRFRPSVRNWWRRNRVRPSYMGLFAPLHRSLGFRHVSKGSLLLHLPNQALRSQKETCHSLSHLRLGDNHTTSHLPSIPRIRPVAHFAQGVTLPPIRGVD